MNRQPIFNQNNDFTFPTPLGDSISTISVNGNPTTPSNLVVAGAWDNTFSCFELQRSNTGGLANVIAQGQIKHDAPVLCSDIGSDGFTTFSAGCDTQIRMW
jgi:WD40 repeat protein